MEEKKYLEETDKRYLWHPFTQMNDWTRETPVIISEGKGCYIKDLDGKWYIDGVSSLWVNLHGHRKQEIDEALKNQIDRISHSTLLGLSNVPAIALAEKLVGAINPVGRDGPALDRVFYSDNGSTSVEVALKMAFQYWKLKGVAGRNSFLSLESSYHGDTLGAVSVGGIDIFHGAFGPLLFKTFRAPSPYCYRCGDGLEYPGCGFACLGRMEDVLRSRSGEIAALIIEPIVQAAGGMIVSPPGFLRGVRDLCTRYNILMIADEVATGFGRTGRMLACEHEAVVPDIICLSKGITGGYLPLAATVTTDEVYSAFLGEFRELKTFFHGHSYTGNPLACAAAIACLEIFEKEDTLKHIRDTIMILEEWLVRISGLPHVGNVRSRGLMAGVELVKDKETKEPYAWEERAGWRVALLAREGGVIIRPLGNVVVIMPPLCIGTEDMEKMLRIIEEAIVSAHA